MTTKRIVSVVTAMVVVGVSLSSPCEADDLLPQGVADLFNEPVSVADRISGTKTSVIYRFFALAPERYLRSFAVTIKVASAKSPLDAQSGEFIVKTCMDKAAPIIVSKGVLTSEAVEDLVSRLFLSEIFLLAGRDPPKQTDDGGAYITFKIPMGFTYFIERTNSSGCVVVSRSEKTSIPGDAAAAPFIAIAEKAHAESLNKDK